MGLKTPLYDIHVSLGAKIIDFGGWDMPLSYGSQLEEHRAVRRDSGIFDVSHMCVIDLTGARVREFLRHLLANDVAKLTVPGSALYTCMLLPSGGVIDDLIAYFLTDQWFRLVVNAGTRGKDLEWFAQHAAPFGVSVRERSDLAILAVQGPLARAKTASLLSAAHGETALGIARFAAAAIPGFWRVPDIRARTASRSCCRPKRPRRCGGRSARGASRRPGWALGIRCGWRRG
jgi:aminomethyltransferase